MKLLKLVAFGMVAVALTACSNGDLVTRNAQLAAPNLNVDQTQEMVRDYRLHSVRFAVPADMTVSEANSYYPIADIVWRGDPLGNRAQQITDIFQTAIQSSGQGLTGSVPITVDVELARFHSLTERTRYSVGGVHSIKFDLIVRHAETGEILEERRRINGDLAALGGYAAMAADNAGQTQKARITTHLTSLFFRELTGMGNVSMQVAANL